MAVGDDEDLVVIVLAVALVGLAEFVLDEFLETDGRDAALVMAVTAGPVVLSVVHLLERDALLLELGGQPVNEGALLLLFVVGAVPVIPVGVMSECPVDREDLDATRFARPRLGNLLRALRQRLGQRRHQVAWAISDRTRAPVVQLDHALAEALQDAVVDALVNQHFAVGQFARAPAAEQGAPPRRDRFGGLLHQPDERQAAAPAEEPTLCDRVLRPQRIGAHHVSELMHVQGKAGLRLHALRHPQQRYVRKRCLTMASPDVGVSSGEPDLLDVLIGR